MTDPVVDPATRIAPPSPGDPVTAVPSFRVELETFARDLGALAERLTRAGAWSQEDVTTATCVLDAGGERLAQLFAYLAGVAHRSPGHDSVAYALAVARAVRSEVTL